MTLVQVLFICFGIENPMSGKVLWFEVLKYKVNPQRENCDVVRNQVLFVKFFLTK